MLDIWTFSVSCGVHCWSGLWRGVTTCMSVDCDKGDCEDHIHINVQAASGSTQDSWCLLDALWGASIGSRVSFDFMFFQSTLLGARCRQTSTRAGHALVRILQSIPTPPVNSWESFDEIDNRWMHYLDHLEPEGEKWWRTSPCSRANTDLAQHTSHMLAQDGLSSASTYHLFHQMTPMNRQVMQE